MNKYINIDIGEFLAPEMRDAVRRAVADDTLEHVNESSPLIEASTGVYVKYIKRIIDILVSLFALLVLFPVNLVIGICTFFDVGRPLFFSQERIGKGLKPFHIVKFRNMTNKTDENGNLLPGKDRVTKFGKFVRKTSLDELLNFWSILKGDMSLIGPRPVVTVYTKYMSERHKQRYLVRPGLECPFMQNENEGLTWADQFENDIWYVQNVSFVTDCKMVVALVKMVFSRKSSSMRGSANRGSFVGYFEDGTSMNSRNVPSKYVERARLAVECRQRV